MYKNVIQQVRLLINQNHHHSKIKWEVGWFSHKLIFFQLQEDDMLALCLRPVSLPPNGLWVFEHRDQCKVNYSKTQSCCLQIEEKWHVGKLQLEQKKWGSYWLFIPWRKGERKRKITIWEGKRTKTGSESSSEFWGKSESEQQRSGSHGCYSQHIGCLGMWSQNQNTGRTCRKNIKAKLGLCSIWMSSAGLPHQNFGVSFGYKENYVVEQKEFFVVVHQIKTNANLFSPVWSWSTKSQD